MVRLQDGMWLAAEGVRTEYAEDIYEITPQDDRQGLSLLCPTKHIRSRGDTLNISTITLVSWLLRGAVQIYIIDNRICRISKPSLTESSRLRPLTSLARKTKALILTCSLMASLKSEAALPNPTKAQF